MGRIPSYTSIERAGRRVLMDNVGLETDEVTIYQGADDAGAAEDGLFRAGNAVVEHEDSVDGSRFVEADHADRMLSTPASVISSEIPDGDWADETITVQVDDTPAFDVVLGAGDDTLAEVIAALEADPQFAALCVAEDDGTGKLQIRTAGAGAHKSLKVTSTLATAFGAAGQNDTGTQPRAGVTLADCFLEMDDGTATDATAVVAISGHGDLSEILVGGVAGTLKTTSPDVYALLVRQGWRFSS